MPTGLTRDVGWEIGVSRTLPHPGPLVWDFVTSPAGLALWLGEGTAALPTVPGTPYRTGAGVTGEVRGYRPGVRLRLTHGPTTVQLTVTPAGDGSKSVLRFHQERLADAAERERQRAHWRAVMDLVAAGLDGP
ncbi:SRPBCC domain-containing protein [Kitasatospora sp. NPDC096147]|uniref:SRPBCC family protein n=1 Tax=Kitasatospora sp. NPDC096147 TaxID=3364093 RepID=UPI0037F237C6